MEKHEYRDGHIIAMAGGSYEHSRICTNTGREIGNRLKDTKCFVLDSNMRVRPGHGRSYVYPDISIVCGKPLFDPHDGRHTIINPRVLIEVLSPSTERYDRGTKFDDYRTIESFQEYVLISQQEARVEAFFHQPDGSWLFNVAVGRSSLIKLQSLDVILPLDEVYTAIEFEQPDAAATDNLP